MNKKNNSAWVFRFLSWYCPTQLYEGIEGDLIQKFEKDVNLYGERKAKRRLLWSAVRFFRPGIVLRNKFPMNQNQLPMFRNYFITSLRHIRKSKVNFSFKLGGLSLAIFSFLAIALYVESLDGKCFGSQRERCRTKSETPRGLVSLLLVSISGSFSAWKSGQMNPVEVIKSE